MEIAAGALGAFGSVAAVSHSVLSGFSARHDHAHDAQVAETQQLIGLFNKALKEGEIDEEDYEEFQRKKEVAIQSADEYFDAISDFKSTSSVNLVKKSEMKHRVREWKRKHREANRSLRTHYYNSGSDASDVSSVVASPGTSHSSRKGASGKKKKKGFDIADPLGARRRRRAQEPKAGWEGSDSMVLAGERSGEGAARMGLEDKYGVYLRVVTQDGRRTVIRLARRLDGSDGRVYEIRRYRKPREGETVNTYQERLREEYMFFWSLNHPNVVATFDLLQDENGAWCHVIEFYSGGSLFDALDQGSMTPEEKSCSFKQLVNGVNYLHSKGLAHRDLKLDNLYFDDRGCLKISEFTAVTVCRLDRKSGIRMSTERHGAEPYVSPEQYVDQPYNPQLADVWSCGIVYFCMYFQRFPWSIAKGTSKEYSLYLEDYRSGPKEPVARPVGTKHPLKALQLLKPEESRMLVLAMLDPDCQRRYTIEQVVAHPWMQSIEVCVGIEASNHIHTHARKMADSVSFPDEHLTEGLEFDW